MGLRLDDVVIAPVLSQEREKRAMRKLKAALKRRGYGDENDASKRNGIAGNQE